MTPNFNPFKKFLPFTSLGLRPFSRTFSAGRMVTQSRDSGYNATAELSCMTTPRRSLRSRPTRMQDPLPRRRSTAQPLSTQSQAQPSSCCATAGSDRNKAFETDSNQVEDLQPVATARSAPTKKARRSSTTNARIGTQQADLGGPDEHDIAVNGRDEATESDAVRAARNRPPAVNSDYVPIPWKGRLGYACLCTYLRSSVPTVFSSRTTRIASILEHRHPLLHPDEPEHPVKNRPDISRPADVRQGLRFLENLGIANCHDLVKIIKWNDKFGIKFFRLSSEVFPFASHHEYGYKLATFATHHLRRVGKVVAELGHRVTTHPGQFTQLGSPRSSVIEASIRDLEYHDEMLSLLDLPAQQDRDAVMVLHMGGVFGDKSETLQRFRENYAKLGQSIRNRLVLENDDVSWSVHDLLPICEELNIPLVLDFHHNNIIFDSAVIREGTMDIINEFPRIKRTWTRKGITQKMHYSEPTAEAVTPRERRKHSARVATLPPCPNDMDLMIEAKDKEQAVFELMRTFQLPGHDRIREMIPHVRSDNNSRRASQSKQQKDVSLASDSTTVHSVPSQDPTEAGHTIVRDEDVDMGGPDGRVYWPPRMEHWLRPQKRQRPQKATSPEPIASAAPSLDVAPTSKKPDAKCRRKLSPDSTKGNRNRPKRQRISNCDTNLS